MKITIHPEVLKELEYITKLHRGHGAANQYENVPDLVGYTLASIADGSRRPGSWERYAGKHGAGPKTAGWVAKNYLDTDEVAILDIHLIRAGQLCGVFTPRQRVERDYFEMEARFIDFCNVLAARPAVLDCLIWSQMRTYGWLALDALDSKFRGEGGSELSLQQSKRQKRLSA